MFKTLNRPLRRDRKGGLLSIPSFRISSLRRLNQDKGLVGDAAQWLAKKWAELEGRYGRRTALTMAIGMISTMPIPGNITAIIAAAEAIRAIRGWSEKNLSSDDWTVICGQKSAETQSIMSEIVRFNSSPTTQGLRQIQGMLNQLSEDEANAVARKLYPSWRLDESKADAIQEIYYLLLAKVRGRKAMPNPMTSGKADETIRRIDDAFRQYSQEEFIRWVQSELGIATFARWPGGKKTKRDALVDMVNRLAVSNTQTSWKDMSSVDETRGGALRKPPQQEPDLVSSIIRRFLGTKGIQVKSEGTCEQGERADLTGCTPASGEVSEGKPKEDDDGEEKKKQESDISQMREALTMMESRIDELNNQKKYDEAEKLEEIWEKQKKLLKQMIQDQKDGVSSADKKPNRSEVIGAFKPPSGLDTARSYPESLDDDTREDLERYSESLFAGMNRQMRTCPPKYECISGQMKRRLDNIMTAIDNAPRFEKPVQVYRGMIAPPAVTSALIESAKKAMESDGSFTLSGSLTSTSLNPEIALGGFAEQEGGIVFQIKARSGLYMEKVSAHEEEQEILQSPKVKYKVGKIENVKYEMKGKSMIRRVIHLEEEDE